MLYIATGRISKSGKSYLPGDFVPCDEEPTADELTVLREANEGEIAIHQESQEAEKPSPAAAKKAAAAATKKAADDEAAAAAAKKAADGENPLV